MTFRHFPHRRSTLYRKPLYHHVPRGTSLSLSLVSLWCWLVYVVSLSFRVFYNGIAINRCFNHLLYLLDSFTHAHTHSTSQHKRCLSRTTQLLQESTQASALAVVAKGPATLQALQSAFAQHFPASTLSAVQASYAAGDNVTSNAAVTALVSATLDATDAVLTDLNTMEQYIHLTIPKMEDGNNFGVTVQLTALKQITDSKDLLAKGLDELLKYPSTRADALEKCKLPSTSKSVSTTTSQADSAGNNTEKGDNKSTSTSTSKEEKTTESSSSSPELAHRHLAVTAVDVQYYNKSKALFQAGATGYMAALDFLTKNAEKIALPKGEKGSSSAYSSMY